MDFKDYNKFKREMSKLMNEIDGDIFHTMDAKLADFIAKNPGAPRYEMELFVQELFPKKMVQFSKQIFDTYDQTLDIVNSLYDNLGTDISRELFSVRALEKVNTQYLGALTDKETGYIAKKMEEFATQDMTVKELTKSIAEVSDTVKFHAETLAKTQVKGYGRNLKWEKALIAEVDYFRYVDSTLRPNSHEFCIKQVARAEQGISVSLKEIKGMSNGTYLPVFQYCGGFRCLHDWEPDPFYKA